MRRALTMTLAIIIEASLFVLADLITRRRRRDGNFEGLDRTHFGRPAGALLDQPIGADHSRHAWRGLIRVPRHGRSKF